MQVSDAFSAIALVASLISLGFSIYFGLRDRSRLVVTSSISFDGADGWPRLIISIKNMGRRPVIIRRWGGEDKARTWKTTPMFNFPSDLEINENEWREFEVAPLDLRLDTAGGDVLQVVNLWVEDSVGRKYIVRDARKNIKMFLLEIDRLSS